MIDSLRKIGRTHYRKDNWSEHEDLFVACASQGIALVGKEDLIRDFLSEDFETETGIDPNHFTGYWCGTETRTISISIPLTIPTGQRITVVDTI